MTPTGKFKLLYVSPSGDIEKASKSFPKDRDLEDFVLKGKRCRRFLGSAAGHHHRPGL